MAVQPADLLDPAGRLEARVLWPKVAPSKVTAKLTAWITEGVAKAAEIEDAAAKDDAVKAWAYYRAFDEVYQRLIARPASAEDKDEGSRQYLVTQMTLMQERRDEAKTLFDTILADAVAVVIETLPVRAGSHSAPIAFRL